MIVLLLLLLLTLVTLNLSLGLTVRALCKARDRVYTYAVDRADLTERGSAYSDMATVIVLDGKVNDFWRRPEDHDTGESERS